MAWGEKAQTLLTEIAACSAPGPGVTRLPFTPEHKQAKQQIEAWMLRAGLGVSMDAAGTLIGHKAGSGPALLLGSHQDSVRNAGRYDGIMGVLLACLAVEMLAEEGRLPDCPIDVLAFADEEGVRFPTALLGPRALTGTLDLDVLDMTDRDGIALGTALREFGGDPSELPAVKRNKEDVRAYLELHIEQGPVLETVDLAVGTVTGICGIERNRVVFTGQTGHAGTVPMEGRQDALVAASEFILQTSRLVPEGLRATIGTLQLHPDVVNAIPDSAELTLEIRALFDAARDDFAEQMRAIGNQIAAQHRTPFTMERTYTQPAVPCADWIMDAFDTATAHHQTRTLRLPSGATHDASAMSDLCHIGMLFLRCKGGVSHRPEEFASAEDMDVAIRVLADVIAQAGA